MKIVVDEMPNTPKECLFSNSNLKNEDICQLTPKEWRGISDHDICKNTKDCPYLTIKNE